MEEKSEMAQSDMEEFYAMRDAYFSKKMSESEGRRRVNVRTTQIATLKNLVREYQIATYCEACVPIVHLSPLRGMLDALLTHKMMRPIDSAVSLRTRAQILDDLAAVWEE